MIYNVYLSKLSEMSKSDNPRQAYLYIGFNKTSLYRTLLAESRKGTVWACGEKLIYKYLGYAAKAEKIKHKVTCDTSSLPDNLNTSSNFFNYHRKMTSISNEFYSLLGHHIQEEIRGIKLE